MSDSKPNPEPTPDPAEKRPADSKRPPGESGQARRRRPDRAGAEAGLAAGLMQQAGTALGGGKDQRRGKNGQPVRPGEPREQAPGAAAESPQAEIDFAAPPSAANGYERYRKEREDWLKSESERLSLPLGKRVDVDIGLGRTATGLLQLDESSLLLDPESRKPRLRVGRLVFEIHEIQSCLRIDD